MYRDRAMPDVPVGDWTGIYAAYDAPRRADGFGGQIDPAVLQRARAGYYGHMSHIDHQINRFLEVLHDFRQNENTWFCFISDHGEMMGDHHLFRKGYPYEGSSRVPLILKGPAAAKLPGGSARDGVAELRDIMPTLLDCAGLPAPATVEGRSLLPMARGQTNQVRDYLHGEHALHGQSIHWITDARDKYVWHSASGVELLFDMIHDPQELHNQAASSQAADRLTNCRQRLIHELTGREEGYSDGRQLILGGRERAVLSHVMQGQA